MKKLWEYFENMEEVVYASDIDTYELIYLNKKGCEAFGVKSLEELTGKKCYEIVRGNTSPCMQCSNKKLQEGHFFRWRDYNALLEKYMIIFDTIMVYDGRRCRIEVAVDITFDEMRKSALTLHQRMERMINTAVTIATQKETPMETVQSLVDQIAHILQGDRAYIFEVNKNGGIDNTYEWAQIGFEKQQEKLQNLSSEVWEYWHNLFKSGRKVTVSEVEMLQYVEPELYELLRCQKIQSITVIPLYIDKKYIGFLGVNNPAEEILPFAADILDIMGHYISTALDRCRLIQKLNETIEKLEVLSYYDKQTHFGNRHALERYTKEVMEHDNVGVFFCDITGLKKVNDTQGHLAGDALIEHAAESLVQVFQDGKKFRFGGDELIVVCHNISKEELIGKVAELKEVAKEKGVILAVGASYKLHVGNIDESIREAEGEMYADKSAYYKEMGIQRRIF